MGDMVFAPVFAEVDSEREVVLEEIAMYEDQPQELVHDLIAEAVFGNHPLGRPVIGTAEVISTISRRSITAYHRSMYVPATSSLRRPGISTTTSCSACWKGRSRRSARPRRGGDASARLS